MIEFLFKKWKQFKTSLSHLLSYPAQVKHVLEHPISRILCVDDDQNFTHFVQRLGYPLEIQIDTAFSIEGAKKEIEAYPEYDAYIIDGHLPDGSGFELVAWIREKQKSDVPIGFISRIYQDAGSFRILKESLKVNYVLDKPIKPAEVHQLLRQLAHLEPVQTFESVPHDLLKELRTSYEKTIPNKLELVERLILNVQKNPNLENLQNLRKEIHKIGGSAGSYGFMAVSELCKNLEIEIFNQMDLTVKNQADWRWDSELDQFFTQLKLHFQMELPETEPLIYFRSRHLPSLYLVDEDPIFLSQFTESKQSFEILTEQKPDKAVQTLVSQDFFPHILLFNSRYSSSILNGYDFLKAYYQKNDNQTSFSGLLVEKNDWKSIFEALKKGMTLILEKPLTLPVLFPLIDQIPFKPLPLHYKVLVIDDDPDIRDYIVKTLKYTGLEIHLLENFQKLEEVIKEFKPDLILLDINLTDGLGIGLLNRIRKKIEYNGLLLGMITVMPNESSLIEKCYESNVSDIIFKPIEEGLLQRKVAHLFKKQDSSNENVSDISGIENVKKFKEYLTHLQTEPPSLFSRILVLFEIQNFVNFSQKDKKRIFITISHSLDELLKKYEMVSNLGKGIFGLIFLGYSLNFIQLIIENFLHHLQFNLEKELGLKMKLNIHAALVEFSGNEQKEQLLNRALHLLSTIQSNIKSSIKIVKEGEKGSKKVWLLGDRESDFNVLKRILEPHHFKISFFRDLKDDSFEEISLFILGGSFAGEKGLALIKKLFDQMHIQIPILHLSHFPNQMNLEKFFEGIHYFTRPFPLIVILS